MLLFAIKFNKIVKTVIINGVLLGTKEEIDYVDKGRFSHFYPEVWEKFSKSSNDKNNPAEYHYKVLSEYSDDMEIKKSAKALEDLESPLLMFSWPGYTKLGEDSLEDFDPVPYKIYGYFLKNNFFLPDNYVMDNLDKITCPVYILHGRYDMVCPYQTAYNLSAKLNNSKLYTYLGGHIRDYDANQMMRILVDTILV